MGLFDFLKPRPKESQIMGLAETISWINSIEESVKEEKREKLGAAYKDVPEKLDNLLQQVDALDDTPAGDVDARLKKVVSTNKPAYLEAMRRHIRNLKDACEKDDVFSFKKIFDKTLDDIGEVNFGDGRYLGFVYEKQIRGIHKNCKKLVAIKKEADELAPLTPGEREILDLKSGLDVLTAAVESEKNAEKNLAEMKAELQRSKERITSLEAGLSRVRQDLK
ncbi:MAG: hypothetical protein GF334_11275, partial [Candidatus Altiarchaeales archaeon]|nr:hypothetical protein [Candidatus Altiarchaeales archaeon]